VEEIRSILSRFANTCDVASLAIVRRSSQYDAAWLPAGISKEPIFLAYSITKTVIAVLLLQFTEEGRIGVDDPLAAWFPDIPQSRQISLRQLLNHTAGVPDYGPLPQYHEAIRTSPSTPWNFERFAAETFNKGLGFAPGEGWAYSNAGYMLLRNIAEMVSGKSFRTLVSDRIAGPFELRTMFVPESIEDLSLLAPARSRALSMDGTLRDVRERYHPGWVSHGVVASSASDLARFLDAVLHHRLVSKESVDQMMELVPVPVIPSPEDRNRKPSYGLGLMGDHESSWGPIWGHNGGGPGYTASAFFAPELGDACVCAMASTEDQNFGAERLVFEMFDSLARTS
jgi:D-alanyl-D-alanine carboxypeptidase